MELHQIDPLTDSRWRTLVERHPRASIFHTVPWLESLRRTYGYRPIAFTTSPPGEELRDGLAFCRVESCLTGRRLVSLPFSDHCDPLLDDGADLSPFFLAIEQAVREENIRYVELRPEHAIEGTTSLHRS
jgi:hypothetical protein